MATASMQDLGEPNFPPRYDRPMNIRPILRPLFLLSIVLLLAGAVTVSITNLGLLGWALLVIGLVTNVIAAGRTVTEGSAQR